MGAPIFEDKTIECCDCHESFVFEAGEQEFFFKKGFQNPKRCKSCKAKKRQGEVRQEY